MPGLLSKVMKWLISPPSGSGNSILPNTSTTETNTLLEKLRRAPDDLQWMFPPSTVTDPEPWDKFWTDQIQHGVAGFVHMFIDDGQLVDAMIANGIHDVLCVGNGISLEARALSEAGFAVTALDLSPLAARVASDSVPGPDLIQRLLGGRPAKPGGSLTFVTGDLRDTSLCAGPFGAVIERRTLQLFPDEELPAAMQAVANRLAAKGLFFSHVHDGGWRPPAAPRNRTRDWFDENGWPHWRGETPLAARVAWTFTSTG
jgi:hypothetical protein